MQKLLDCDDIWFLAVFEIVDYESELKILKFAEIADPMWWTKMQEVTLLE